MNTAKELESGLKWNECSPWSSYSAVSDAEAANLALASDSSEGKPIACTGKPSSAYSRAGARCAWPDPSCPQSSSLGRMLIWPDAKETLAPVNI